MEVDTRSRGLFRSSRTDSGKDDVYLPVGVHAATSYLAVKRILDVIISLSAIVLLSPLLLLISLIIKLDSRGPVLYRRRVVAQNGHSPHSTGPETVSTFDAFKFRTMSPDADDLLASDPELLREYYKNFKLDQDPRITRIGQFLRTSNLDELPQFFNVLLGQMSVVGPRIITPPEIEKYGEKATALLSVRPGMSGLWQVRRESDHSYQKRVKLDMIYIRTRNTWLDIKIIFQTIVLATGRRGSG